MKSFLKPLYFFTALASAVPVTAAVIVGTDFENGGNSDFVTLDNSFAGAGISVSD